MDTAELRRLASRLAQLAEDIDQVERDRPGTGELPGCNAQVALALDRAALVLKRILGAKLRASEGQLVTASADETPAPKPTASVRDHPAFGMWANHEEKRDADAYMRRLRRGRFDAV